MKITFYWFIIILNILVLQDHVSAQDKPSGIDAITSSDLESHVSFLASPLLSGRMNGEPGLDIALNYISSQAKLMGLLPGNGKSHFQPYSMVINTIDKEKTMISVISGKKDTVTIREPLCQLIPTGPADFAIEGEVVFAGYGLRREDIGYNDFKNISLDGKIILIMTGAPDTSKSRNGQQKEAGWSSLNSIQEKITDLLFTKAKAILIVNDPKSGYEFIDDQFPGIYEELSSTKTLKGEESPVLHLPGVPKIIFIHRSVADALLNGTGKSLKELQEKIDSDLKSFSFPIRGKQIKITESVSTVEKTLNNVAAIIEGSDPILKKEYIVFSGHADHIGGSGRHINTGADDNASGCAALLSIARAFQGLEIKPLRSVLFLWFSGEEIGLFGSRYYINNPLVPLEMTVADLNMDMIGRVKGVADTTDDNPMTGEDEVFVITGNQSKELLTIAADIDKSTPLDFDYSLSGRNHELQLFARSDHFNFVSKDIPVLFFSTGLHTDYHTPGDVTDKINFKKMELITRTVFRIGYEITNRKTKLTVDNPYSTW